MNLPDIIYNHFQANGKERKKQEVVTFAPSYLSDCGRKIFYSKQGIQPTNPPDLPAMLKMKWGDILHQDIQKILNEKGVLESFEEPRKIEYKGVEWNYFYDGILNVNGKRAILEIKTVYASGYKSIEGEPKPEHVYQTICYMTFENITSAVILYAGRDNGFLKQHNIELIDGKLFVNGTETDYMPKWRGKLMKLEGLKEAIEAGRMPDRDFQIVMKRDGTEIASEFQKDNKKYKSDWQCNYCSYRAL